MLFMMLLADRPDDADYLEDIYHTHYRLLYAQALKVLRHPQDAEDVVQAVMLKMTQKIHILRRLECNKQASYLVISVRNTAINLYRKNKSRAMRQAELIEDIVSADLKENPEV